MLQLLKTCVATILITGSTSSTSGATEASCLKPAPQSLQAILAAKPRTFQGITPYEEFILHPAFDKEVKNVGNFVLTSDNKLLRRQNTPQIEEMEIGLETIIIRRNGSEVSQKIPNRMKPFFVLLRAAILDQPLLQQDNMQHWLQVTQTGWNAEIAFHAKGNGKITFSGCGTILKSIGLKLRNGQERMIRFGI
jgi:hypothetical protein